jgi:hypothetical protein
MLDDVMAENFNTTGSGSDQTERHANCSGFPRAIRTKEAKDVTAINFQVQVVHSEAPTILFDQVARS